MSRGKVSTIFIADEEEVKNRYEYDAWGNVTECEEQVENRYKYTGQQYDPVTQQYYLRARYYNPVIARFTQEDVYFGDGLNLYAYCNNNPVMYCDPSGYAAQTQNAINAIADFGKKMGVNTPSYTPAQLQALENKINNAIGNTFKNTVGRGDACEDVTKYIMKDIYKYEEISGKVHGVNGIDGVFYKKDAQGRITDVQLTETKYNKSKLGKTSNGKQLSEQWYKKKIDDLRDEATKLKDAVKKSKNLTSAQKAAMLHTAADKRRAASMVENKIKQLKQANPNLNMQMETLIHRIKKCGLSRIT